MVDLTYQSTTKRLKNIVTCDRIISDSNKVPEVGIYLQGSVQVSLIRKCSCRPDDLEEEDVVVGTSRLWSDRSINNTVVTLVRMIRHL